MQNSKIEWTNKTWNPLTGCTKISSGCKNCYAEIMAKRLQSMKLKKYENGFQPTFHSEELNRPLKWKKSQLIFVDSMSDIFQPGMLESQVETFKIMNKASHHIFQVLTKRPGCADENLIWSENIWLGVTIESGQYEYRKHYAREIPAKYKFISFEPLIGGILDFDFTGFDWIIVGGETGPNARFLNLDWVIEIYKACQKQNIPFFFKNARMTEWSDNTDMVLANEALSTRQYPKALEKYFKNNQL